MSERPSFLPPASFAEVAPAPDGFTAAMGRAKRRRARQLGEAGLAVGLAVALLTSVQMPTRDSGQDRVDIADQDSDRPAVEDDQNEIPADDQVVRPADPTPTSRPGSTVTGGTTAVSRPAGPAKAPVVAAPGTTPARPRSDRQTISDGLAWKRPVTRTDPMLGGSCVSQPSGWCFSASANRNSDETDLFDYDLTLTVCRALDESGQYVDFDTALQADFVISSDKEDLWTWSVGQRFDDTPDSLYFGPGSCVTWTTPSALVDDYGYKLDPGTYKLTARSIPAVFGENRFATATVTAE